ncbi:MAG TPA: histidine kinase, partial [Gemmatimonadaceae bacterium]
MTAQSSHNDAFDAEDQPPRIRWGLVASLFACAFVARFAYFYLDDLTRQEPGTFLERLLEEGTGIFAGAALFPLVVLVERRFPVTQGRWRRTWPMHVGAYVLYSALHTTVMALSRNVLFPLFGQGTYDYGVMSVRYFMEAAQDVVSYFTFIGILTLVRVQQHLRFRERRAAELQRDAANAKLEALSLRLQPHFLFNALNTISSTVYDDPVAADEMIGRLGDLLRRTLRTGEQHEIRLDDELETLRAYLTFIDARFGERLTIRLDVDPAAHALSVPGLLLQPLVENAVRHGSTREFERSEIEIRIAQRGTTLTIVVENDVATPATQSRDGTGL